MKLVVRIGKPMAAIANGQRVPEDLQPAIPAQLVSCMLGNHEPAPIRKAV